MLLQSIVFLFMSTRCFRPRVSEVEGIKTEVASVRDRLLTMSTGLTEVFELKANVDFMSKSIPMLCPA